MHTQFYPHLKNERQVVGVFLRIPGRLRTGHLDNSTAHTPDITAATVLLPSQHLQSHKWHQFITTIPHMTLETSVETQRPFNITARKTRRLNKNLMQLPLTDIKQQVHPGVSGCARPLITQALQEQDWTRLTCPLHRTQWRGRINKQPIYSFNAQ